MSNDERARILAATSHLQSGRCVAMPTETVYGLAARIDSETALQAVFRHKMRPSFDPLIVHVSNLDQVPSLVADWPPAAASLAKHFWPGALTLVVKKSATVSSIISSGLDTVGIRMPDHTMARQLIEAVGVPLAAPSANRFGRTSPTTADHVRGEFPEAIASGEIFILDGGPCQLGVESTVCRVAGNEVSILRPGGVTEEDLRAHFAASPEAQLKQVRVTRDIGHHASPGHTEHHYETRKPLIVAWVTDPSNSPWMSVGDFIEVENRKIAKNKILEVVLSANPALAARELYAKLRTADHDSNCEALLIQRNIAVQNSESGLWLAIDDRLTRAARRQLGSKGPSPSAK